MSICVQGNSAEATDPP